MSLLRSRAGTSYLEVIAAMALVGMALLISSGTVVRFQRLAQLREERMRAEHALATEVDTLLATRPVGLVPGSHPWSSGADQASSLREARGTLEVEALSGLPLLSVEVVLRWDGSRVASRGVLLEAGP